jgi:hypothetical protein
MHQRVREHRIRPVHPARAPVHRHAERRRDAVGRRLAGPVQAKDDRAHSHGSAPLAIRIIEK